MSSLQKTALTLTIIGALNWGVMSLFRFDVVAQFAGGSTELLSRFIYIIIGIAGIISIGSLFSDRKVRYDHTKVIELKRS